jgi:hypothetical protein
VDAYWSLSDKASTLDQKSAYLDQYVSGIEGQTFAPNNATIFPTANTAFAQNLIALKSLQGRMHQIKGMDESSFAYQTAIQQITAQEQGEAQALTSTLEGCWMLQHHPMLWGWHLGLLLASLIFLIIGAIIWAAVEYL